MLSDIQIKRFIHLADRIEANLQNLKDEYLMALTLEQEKLINSAKYDYKNYHKHPLK